MIATPRLEHIPIDTIILGTAGYVIGLFAEVDARFSALVLAIAGLANHLLFQVADQHVRPRLDISSEALYVGTNAVVSVVTILVARQFEIISHRVAGICIFGSLVLLAARMRVLADS